jgi:hypothetical protein
VKDAFTVQVSRPKEVAQVRRKFGFVVVGLMALLVVSSAQALTAEDVLTGSSDTWDPAQGVDPITGDAYLAWTQYTPRGHADAWFRKNSDSRVRLNLTGHGWAYGMDPAISTIAYQQNTRGNSDIKLYDWSTNTRHSPGPLVNSLERWEYEPSISAEWLLFARLNASARPDVRKLYLYDTATQELRLLDTFIGGRSLGSLFSGQVNGDWVVWWKASTRWTHLDVYRYQISTGQTEHIPRPAGRYDYAPSVAPDGTVYFIRSRLGCGATVRMRSYDTNGTMQIVSDIPAGRDVNKMFTVSRTDGSTDVYYDSWRCGRANGNIYKVNVPAGGGTTVSATIGGQAAVAGSKRFSARLLRPTLTH